LLDLEAIAEYIAEDSPEAATRFIRQALDAAASLRDLADRGRYVPELAPLKVRELIIGSYRLIYRVQGNTVSIAGLVHGARGLAAPWEREGRKLDR
jgi:plasmid stabilization system protein ParE